MQYFKTPLRPLSHIGMVPNAPAIMGNIKRFMFHSFSYYLEFFECIFISFVLSLWSSSTEAFTIWQTVCSEFLKPFHKHPYYFILIIKCLYHTHVRLYSLCSTHTQPNCTETKGMRQYKSYYIQLDTKTSFVYKLHVITIKIFHRTKI